MLINASSVKWKMKTIEFKKTVRSSSNIMSENFSGTMVLIANVLSTNQELVQVSKFSSSAYESQVTIKTFVQSENIGKMKIPSFLCQSSLAKPLYFAILGGASAFFNFLWNSLPSISTVPRTIHTDC